MPVTYFIALIIVLSALRQRLVFEIAGVSLLLFGTTKLGIGLYSFLMLPGTIIHELSHWLVAEILQVRTGRITIFPDFEGEDGGQRLGSVATERTDPLRGFLIGVAPFFTGLLALFGLGRVFALGLSQNYAWWILALAVYGIVVISNSMLISREDRRTWPFVILLLFIAFFLTVKFAPAFLSTHLDSFENILTPLNQVLGVTAALNLVMIGGSYLLRRFVERLTKKRIVHT